MYVLVGVGVTFKHRVTARVPQEETKLRGGGCGQRARAGPDPSGSGFWSISPWKDFKQPGSVLKGHSGRD